MNLRNKQVGVEVCGVGTRRGPHCSPFLWLHLIWFGFSFSGKEFSGVGGGAHLAPPPQFKPDCSCRLELRSNLRCWVFFFFFFFAPVRNKVTYSSLFPGRGCRGDRPHVTTSSSSSLMHTHPFASLHLAVKAALRAARACLLQAPPSPPPTSLALSSTFTFFFHLFHVHGTFHRFRMPCGFGVATHSFIAAAPKVQKLEEEKQEDSPPPASI